MMIREQQSRDEKTTGAQADTTVRTPRHDPSTMILAAYLRELASQGSQPLTSYGTVRSP